MVEKLVYKYKMRAINYIDGNNITVAKNVLIEGLKISNKDIDLLNILGLCFYKKCEFEEAEEIFRKSILLDKKSRAIKYLEKIKAKKFQEIIEKYNEGIRCLNNLEIEKALEIFIDISKIEDSLIEPYIILIEINIYMKNYKEGLKYLENLIKIDSGNEKIAKYKKIIEENKDNLKDDLKETKLNHKEIAEVRFLLATYYEEVGNIEMAVEEYKKYIDESEKKAYEECALYNLIGALGKLERLDEKKSYEI
ncbi:MAG: tetratricopeptide repeat protein, partial [Clostridium sp.]|uniref:tetratricopeptide repeat protein n=1 Tax=Clostridium sp. TaxID=1506 RepID=UPI003EE656E7